MRSPCVAAREHVFRPRPLSSMPMVLFALVKAHVRDLMKIVTVALADLRSLLLVCVNSVFVTMTLHLLNLHAAQH